MWRRLSPSPPSPARFTLNLVNFLLILQTSSWAPPVWLWQFLLICLHPAVPSVPLLLPQSDPHVHPCPTVTWETVSPVFLQQRWTEFIYVPVELKINPNVAFPDVPRCCLVSGVCDYFPILHQNLPNQESYHQSYHQKLNPIKRRWIFYKLLHCDIIPTTSLVKNGTGYFTIFPYCDE